MIEDMERDVHDKEIHRLLRISFNINLFNKNPVYVSTKSLMKAPIQKKTYNDFSSSSGDLVRRGWAAVNSTAEHRSTLLSIELHCIFCRTLEGPAYTWLFNFRPYVHPSVRPSVRMSPIRSVYS